MANVINPEWNFNHQTFSTPGRNVILTKDISAALSTTVQPFFQDPSVDFAGQFQIWVSNRGGETLDYYYNVIDLEISIGSEEAMRRLYTLVTNDGEGQDYNGARFIALVLNIDAGDISLNRVQMTCKL